MKTHGVLIFLLMFISAGSACDGPAAESPVQPGGTIPDLFGAIAEGDYVLAGAADLAALRTSAIGSKLMEMLLSDEGSPGFTQIDVAGVKQMALALGFNDRSWPNMWRAFPFVMALGLVVDADALAAQLGDDIERSESGKATIFKVPLPEDMMISSADEPLLIATHKMGVVLVSNQRELLDRSLLAIAGRETRMQDGGRSARLFQRADMAADAWVVLEQKTTMQNLLQFLEPFDWCSLALRTDEALQLEGIFSFMNAEPARRMVAGHELILNNIEGISDGLPAEAAAQTKLFAAFLKTLRMQQAGTDVFISTELDAAWLDQHMK